MGEEQKSALVDSMAPRWVPEESARLEIVSREGLQYILDMAADTDGYLIAQEIMCTNDNRAFEVRHCSYESPEERAKKVEDANARVRARGGEPIFSVPEHFTRAELRLQREAQRLHVANNSQPRKILRELVIRAGLTPPPFLKPKVKEPYVPRYLRPTTHKDVDAVIHRGDGNTTIFVAEDSENVARTLRRLPLYPAA